MATRNRVRIITFSGVIITLYPVIMRTRFYKPRFFMQFCNSDLQLKRTIYGRFDECPEKEWAKTLYLKENLTQQEIADRVGVSRVSVSNWVRAGKWEEQKVGLTLTRQEQVANLYRQVAEINKAIAERPEGERFPSSKEADILGKLSAAIRNMEQEVGIADIISVLTGLIDWVRAADLEKAKEITRLADAYIKDKL